MAKKTLCTILTLIMLLCALPLFSQGANAQDPEAVTFDDIVAAASTIIRQNEGHYYSVSADDNGALSIGWIQWHANRALNLLKTIVAADTAEAQEILGEALYKEITTATSWSTRILTKDEAARVSLLIDTDQGHKAQDDLAAKDISSYINHAIGLGITDPVALVYYADIENQCGQGGALRVAKAAAALAGSYEAITIEEIYKASLADVSAGNHPARRNRTYNNCLLLNWELINIEYEVWNVNSARNVRETPDTQSTLVTSIAAGTKIIVTQKAPFKGLTRARTTMGWITVSDGSCTLDEELTGGYVPAPVIFDLDGGSMNTSAPATETATKLNAGRSANDLSIFNSDYGYSAVQTNPYGYECTVDAEGKVITTPAYGVCKSEIPEGGMVISAHGTMGQWLMANVKLGSYIIFNEKSMLLTVFADENSMLYATAATTLGGVIGELPKPEKEGYYLDGWADESGNAASTGTVCNTPFCITLKAVWKLPETMKITYDTDGGAIKDTASAKLDGVNVGRGTDQLIIYIDQTSTGQNAFGNEAAIDKNGKVIAVYGYGIGNSAVPEGGFVLSGHGKMDKWIAQNLSVGTSVIYNKQTGTVTVCKTDDAYNAINRDIPLGGPIGTLPTVTKEHCKFLGWYDKNGVLITRDSIFTEASTSLTAKWEVLPGELSFDANGGKCEGYSGSFALAGTDISRGSGQLVLYKDRATTKTNVYGTEAVIGKNGVVAVVYPYGAGNAKIPEGCTVISGNGAASSWIKNHVKQGCYTAILNNTLYVWDSYSAYLATLNTEVKLGEQYGDLPIAKREGFTFKGWADPDGNIVTSDSTVAHLGNITLRAVWEKLCTVTFDPAGGTIADTAKTVTANGINISRTADTLVIYAGSAKTGTNPYGSQAIVSFDGRVIAIRQSGNTDTSIPEGCYVISGHGKMSSWLGENVKVGSLIVLNGYKISVYDSPASYDAADGRLYVAGGTAMG
ncbi:MAG: InlB B-repeat-containing protein, partial [Clostridia bacterium]|nr:InlB B-repeat-containing protein [Clostridia bacterium]